MRNYGSKQVSKRSQRMALEQMLRMTTALDRLQPDSLSRSYGLPVDEISKMLAYERQRREWAA